MKPFRLDLPSVSFFTLLLLFYGGAGLLAAGPMGASPVLWDNPKPDASPGDHSDWQQVPNDLMTLEANPPKASSDPGYYGREYRFGGAPVVENQKLLAAFDPRSGRLSLYGKPIRLSGSDSGSATPLIKVLELEPADQPGPPQFRVVRNVNDEVILDLVYPGITNGSVSVTFGRDEIVAIKASAAFKSFTLAAPIAYAVVPAFIGDDLVYGASDAATNELNLPSENLLLGLVKGEAAEFVVTWPKGKRPVRLVTAGESDKERSISAVYLDNDGQPFFVAPISASGMWHREPLNSGFLEKDVEIGWKRPFPARWKTQLLEETAKTSFAFRAAKGEIWRGVPGSYDYPVWFDGERSMFHLSKKIPPTGEAVIYFLEGQGTPEAVPTPVDILKATLGRVTSEPILDPAGRQLRTHHRRGAEGVRRACTCGCTEAIQSIFEAGQEAERKTDIRADLEDMMYFVQHHVARINEYRRFADDMVHYLQSQKLRTPAVREYLDGLEQTVSQIQQEYSVQEPNMKSNSYAEELVKRTMALTDNKAPDHLKAYMELLKEWRAMGGAQDYVVAQCHIITRKLAQEAGYGCASQPAAVAVAEEVRARARACLRNPDGYEIWADY